MPSKTRSGIQRCPRMNARSSGAARRSWNHNPTFKPLAYRVIGNNGAENRCKHSTLSRKCLTFCEKRLPVAEWAYMRLQKSPAKAKTYATIFAKVWQQPIESYAVGP